MATENSMTIEASLSGSAAKLLLHLLRIGPGVRETPELMRGAGIGNRETFYAAKAQLVEKGLYENPTLLFGNRTPVSEKWTPMSENRTDVSENRTPDVRKSDSSVQYSDSTVWFPHASATAPIYIGTAEPSPMPDPGYMLAPGGRLVPIRERNFSEDFEKSPLALCQEADRMPADGDPKRPTSEFQARRSAQVKAICLAWGQLFPEQNALTTQRAKELLVAAENVSEDVYDALQASAGKDYPFGYARKILASKPKPQPGEEDHSQEYLEVTPEMRAKEEALIAKMRRMNLPKHYFGEDDDEA